MVTQSAVMSRIGVRKKEVLSGAFFWLSAFYFVYCARPEDWILGLKYLPLAKITGFFTLAALLMSLSKTERGVRDLPKEAWYLLGIITLSFMAALTSPIWPGGSFLRTIDFSKIYIVWILTFLLITTFRRLRRVIYIQAASVAVVAIVSIAKGHGVSRLAGVLGGIYSNPNDLAFAIVLQLPFCLAFLLTADGVFRKLLWAGGMLVMSAALVLTASRAGFINLMISGAVCLYHFGIKGKRPQLIVAAALTLTTLLAVAGGLLRARFGAMIGDDVDPTVQSAYGSYEERKFLYFKALEGIEHHPLLGVGPHCFANYSGIWKEVHCAYLQMPVEAGIPALILYLMFFAHSFSDLRKLRKRKDLDLHTTLFVGALHSSLIGFIVGAIFAPVAYNYFPYFAVVQTSVVMAIVREKDAAAIPSPDDSSGPKHRLEIYAQNKHADAVPSFR
jgi:O-antigen ligase